MKQVYTLLLTTLLGFTALEAQTSPTGKELLQNGQFEELTTDGSGFKHWTISGSLEILQGRDTYDSRTGYGIGLSTQTERGKVEQIVSLSSLGLLTGDELEGELHYAVLESTHADGALRLNMAWLDANGQEITTTEERQLLNNPDLWFTIVKKYNKFQFRTLVPSGAVSFRFSIEVNTQSSVRLDDFYLTKLSEHTPFLTALPQIQRAYETEVGKTQTKSYVVQGYNLGQSASLSLPEGSPFEVDKTTLATGNSLSRVNITYRPTQAEKIPRGNHSYGLSIESGTAQASIPLLGYAIDPANPPKISIPQAKTVLRADLGSSVAVSQEIDLHFEHLIDEVKVEVQPTGQGFFINQSTIRYFEKAYPNLGLNIGVNNSKLRISFNPRNKEAGTYNAEIVLSSPLCPTLRYPIEAVVRQGSPIWRETFTKETPAPKGRYDDLKERGYSIFERGLWTWDKGVTYAQEDGQASLYFIQPNSSLSFLSSFGSGRITEDDFPAGIKQVQVQVSYAGSNGRLALEVSEDGGGNWRSISPLKMLTEGKITYPVDSHRATAFRLRRTNSGDTDNDWVVISSIEVTQSDTEDKQSYSSLTEAVSFSGQEGRAELFADFNNQVHHAPLRQSGWQNLSLRGNRPFQGFDQRPNNDLSAPIEEQVAKATLYNTPSSEGERLSSYLISPLLSYKSATTKELGFRLYKEHETEGDSIRVSLLAVKDGRVDQILDIPITKLLPLEKFDSKKWYDILINLAEAELPADFDQFAVSFALESPYSGAATTTTLLVDDVHWGRSNNPTLKVSQDNLKFFGILPKIETEEKSVQVQASNATAPVRVDLIAVKGELKSFLLKTPSIPQEGGELKLSVKSQSAKEASAIAYLQTRGGRGIAVLLFATPKTQAELEATATAVDAVAKERLAYAYRDGNSIVVVAQDLVSAEAFSSTGERLSSVRTKGEEVRLPLSGYLGVVILRLSYQGGKTQTLKL